MKKNKKYNVAFLFDKDNDWIKKKIKLSKININKKYKFKKFYDYSKIKNYDVVFILGYTKIIPKNQLNKNKLNLVVHESKLPKGKGFSPVQWQILEGKIEIPICIFKVEQKIDSGEIFEISKIYIPKHCLLNEIRQLQADATRKIIIKFLKKFPNVKSVKQKGNSTYYRRRNQYDDELNINQSLKNLFNQLRISNNEEYPNYFYIHKKKFFLKIYRKLK